MPGKVVEALTSQARAFYCDVIDRLNAADLPFLVGGAYALAPYTGIERHTKDFDIFVRRRDYDAVMKVLEGRGCAIELTFSHWLGKAYCGEDFIDVIFSSGNALAAVDDEWFAHAVPAKVFDRSVRLCPVEEIIWSKAFIMERERFDGADIMHLLRARADRLDWERLLRRFNSNWRVLLVHVLMFGYVYPHAREMVPQWVMDELLARLQRERRAPNGPDRTCHGTTLSRQQYLIDIGEWGYRDGRLPPHGSMTPEEIASWTEAIEGLSSPGSDEPRT
jgi:hypothetical protein